VPLSVVCALVCCVCVLLGGLRALVCRVGALLCSLRPPLQGDGPPVGLLRLPQSDCCALVGLRALAGSRLSTPLSGRLSVLRCLRRLLLRTQLAAQALVVGCCCLSTVLAVVLALLSMSLGAPCCPCVDVMCGNVKRQPRAVGLCVVCVEGWWCVQ
jgi:hypothetical protein